MTRHGTIARIATLALAVAAVTVAGAVSGPGADATTGGASQPNGIRIVDRDIDRTNATAITIPDSGVANPYPSTITVSDHPGVVTDITVTLNNLTHTHVSDLDVMLVGPGGHAVMLTSDASTSGVTNVTFGFNDGASSTVPNPPVDGGVYLPTNADTFSDTFPAPAPDPATSGTALSVFNGLTPNGAWSLYIVDDAGGDSGTLAGGWSIDIATNAVAPNVAQPYPSSLSVAGLPNGVTDVNVTLKGFTHTFPDDVDVLLQGPGGQKVMLMSDVGGGGGPESVSNLDLTFDDEASGPAPDETALSTGSYRPTNVDNSDTFPSPAPDLTGVTTTLSTFDGTNPNGVWKLFVVDQYNGDEGAINGGWSLSFTTVNAPAAPVITAPPTNTRDRDGAFTMTGTAPAGTTVKIYDRGTLKTTVAATAAGQWTAPIAGVPNGSHTFTATATDGFGNVSAPSAGVVVIVDSIKPQISSTVPTAGAKHAGIRMNIKARASEALRPRTVTRANAYIVVAGTTTHLRARVTWRPLTHTIVINPRAPLAHGTTYKVTITTRVLDLAGNPLDQNKTRAGLQKKTWKFTTR